MSEGGPIRYHGEVVEWSDEKHCGFIRPRGATDADPLVFVSESSLFRRKRGLRQGVTVTYELVRLERTPANERLRTLLRARNTAFLGEELPQAPEKGWESTALLLGVGYLGLLKVASFFKPGLYLGLLWVIIASGLTFLMYFFDKQAAMGGRWRVQEKTLHLFAALGGWPGATVAQAWLRHKTRKESFQTAFWITIALNLLLTVVIVAITWETDVPTRVGP